MTEALALPADTITTLAKLNDTASELAKRIDVLPIETPEQEEHMAKVCSAIKRLISEGETARKKAVKPYKDKSKAIDAAFREPRKALEGIEKKIKTRLAEAVKARALAAEKASEEAFKAMASGDAQAANAAMAKAPEQTKAAKTIHRWKWTVKDYDVAEVPREWLALDKVRVAEYLGSLADGAKPEIPGVVFERDVTIGVKK